MDPRAEIERLGKDLVSDENLKAGFLGFGTNAEAAVAFANSRGYCFALNDVKALLPGNELSDSQLERVAGGSLDKCRFPRGRDQGLARRMGPPRG